MRELRAEWAGRIALEGAALASTLSGQLDQIEAGAHAARDLTEAGVKETFRTIAAQEAGIDQFAVHGSLDE